MICSPRRRRARWMFRGGLCAALGALAAMALLAGGAAASANGPSATGAGHFSYDGGLRTFSFGAVTHQDGSVTGQSQVNDRGDGVRAHLTIDCLEVDGNIAYMSGIISDSSRPSLVGEEAWFSVQDNGAGANASPDLISLVFFNSTPDQNLCHTRVGQATPDNPIQGNVTVH